MSTKSERTAQAELMASKRKGERDITIPPVADPVRRLRCEADDKLFLETYFSERVNPEWNQDRHRIVDEIDYRIRFGGDKALAAPRGGGKTTLGELLVGVKAIVTGKLRFPLIVAATGPDAERILSNVKVEYEFNERLGEDYPEVCYPIQMLEGAPQRCNMQTVLGQRTRMRWSGSFVQFPRVVVTWCPACYCPEHSERKGKLVCRKCKTDFVPWESKASGSVLSTRGLDAAIRGVRVEGQRPDFVLIDDPETNESARSDVQVQKRSDTIDKDIGGIGGTRKRVSRLMLTTIQNCTSLSFTYTDRSLKPSWEGDRLRLVLRWPDRKDLWERYVELRHEGMQSDPPDKTGRAANQLYIDNRDDMDAGVVVSDTLRFNEDILEDGTQRELSTIQHVHNEAADKGWDYVFCELQNDPPEEEVSESDNLTIGIVTGSHQKYAGRLNGLGHGKSPDGTKHVTAFVDVQRDRLWWEVVAWHGSDHSVIAYGCEGLNVKSHDIGTHRATIERLRQLSGRWKAEIIEPVITLVDSGDGETMQAVYDACLELKWNPSKGATPYRPPKGKASASRDPWNWSGQKHGRTMINLVVFSADWFKHRCRDSWRVLPGEPGGVRLFGVEPREHRDFAAQVSSAKFTREYVESKGWKEQWTEGRENHYWDCHCGNIVAHSVLESIERRAPQNRKYGVVSGGI